MSFLKITTLNKSDLFRRNLNRFNGLIDDLLSIATGKGASQLGLEDSEGLYSADNVEAALAEVAGVNSNITSMTGLTDQSGCRVKLTSDQVIPTGVWTKFAFATEDWDIQGEFDNVTNYRFTATKAGYYQVSLNGSIAEIDDGNIFGIRIHKNGVNVAGSYGRITAGATATLAFSTSDIIYLNAGNYLEGFVWHNFGADRTLHAGSYINYMSIMKIGHE